MKGDVAKNIPLTYTVRIGRTEGWFLCSMCFSFFSFHMTNSVGIFSITFLKAKGGVYIYTYIYIYSGYFGGE